MWGFINCKHLQFHNFNFRFNRFSIGTTKIHEVIATASCCTEGMTVKVFDVEGNIAFANGKT